MPVNYYADGSYEITDDDGSAIYLDPAGNPTSVTSSDGQTVAASEAGSLREDGWWMKPLGDSLDKLAKTANSIGRPLVGAAMQLEPLRQFNDVKEALKKAKATYEKYLAELDGLKGRLGTLNDSDRALYDRVRNAVEGRIVEYAQLSDRAASASGPYNTRSAADFMGEIAQYSPQTYEALMGDIGKYAPQTYQSLMSDIKQYDGVSRDDAMKDLGQFQFFDPNQVAGRAGQIAATKTAALDRLFDRTNSTGYANTITRGVDRSSLEDLRRSDVIQKFAPEYMSIDNDSFKEALAQEAGLYAQYLGGRQAYTGEQTALDNLERAGLGFTLDSALKADANERAGLGFALDSALKADANERAGLGFLNQSSIASDAAARASRMQPYAELAAQMDPSLKFGTALMGSDQLMSRNTLSNYTDLAKRLAGTAAGTYDTESKAYGDAYAKLTTALNNYANGGGSGGSSGGSSGGGSTLGKVASAVSTGASIIKGIGTIASFFSSKDAKEGKAPVDGEQVLEGIQTMPVESWKYKDGIEDGQRHIGPYAEDFAARFGGDGKTINMIDAVGVNMAGTKELANKVAELEKQVAQLSQGKRIRYDHRGRRAAS